MQRINPDAPLTSKQKNKRYYDNHREAVLEKNRNYCRDNKSRVNQTRRNYRHQITQVQFDAMLEVQNSKCAICSNEFLKTPHIDHDHRCCGSLKSCEKCRRGLLCDDCNLGLGRFYDSISLLSNAIEYLEQHSKGK